MVTKELLDYIKSQKSKGKSNEDIEKDLEYNNWVSEDIEDAISKVDSLDPSTPFEVEVKDREKVFVIDKTVSHPAAKADTSVEVPIGDKPKVVINVISILFAVISFLLIYRSGVMVAIMSVVNYYSYTTGAMYYFLNEFPLFGWVIMAFSISASIFLYGSFKINTGSRKSFWIGAIILLVMPVSLSYINYKMMYSVAEYFSTDTIGFSQGAPNIPAGASTIFIGVLSEPAFIMSVLTLSILLVSYKKFHFPRKPLSPKSKRLFLTLFLLLVLPSFLVVYSGYSKARNDDFGYSIASKKVNYHVYKPNPIPLGMVYATNFITDKELAGKRNAVQVTYDFAFEQSPDISDSRPIVVKQISVSDDFSMSNFLTTEAGVYSIQKEVSLENAAGGNAYLIKDNVNTGEFMKTLVYLTPDNVLVHLSTLDSGEHDLIDLASSLR